ncbi:acyltransferase [Alloprevotella sp. OH1205_COT-284]|uniref:acyltransferase n=1 Tax=Alloprevotella sp. OH1205_COT-284 TaxID=2491043 RepID=UPI000F5F5D5E|nr:acyltransferase [Alloprevotella sp. OH1205_COT-284]RRD76941.1 acyltransferase [Alloprevotella sp. OH1205_COT-284]
MKIPAEFDDIRPVADHEIRENFEALLRDRLFMQVMRGFVPWLPKGWIRGFFRLTSWGVNSALGFQKRYMLRIMHLLIRKTTRQLTFDCEALPEKRAGYSFLSNHRDIVLDSAMLDVLLIDAKFPNTVQIAIGDNLLIYPWIKRLVRMNKAFIVHRSLSPKELLTSSRLMSRYMHFVIGTGEDNIWIAQREGRAKDSNDRTQPSVLRMMAMGSDAPPTESLRNMHIVPLTISYEYDPCDYLKAKEFQQKRDQPNFKKTKQDDLDNMRIGIFGKKGRVHYHLSPCIDTWLDEYKDLSAKECFEAVAERIDREIHKGYRLYPGNYVAADLLEESERFADRYSEKEKHTFEQYLQNRLDLIEIENKDEAFLRRCILTMYANPLYNHLKAHE